MATAKDKEMLEHRSDQTGRLPVPPLSLAPLPTDIVKAFPSLSAWEKSSNERIADWLKKTNTVLQT